jgi:hypothetical protein
MPGWDQLHTCGARNQHLVQFYNRDEPLLVTKVSHYLREGWRANEALLAAGTAQRNLAMADQLASLGVDVPAAINAGRLVFFDADEMAERLVVGGRADWGRFDALIGAAVRELAAAFGAVRAYGEIVGVLWSRGEYEAAVALEEFWNRLMGASPLALFCAYPIDVLAEDLDQHALDRVIRTHTHVLPVGENGNLGVAVERAMVEVLGERSHGLRKLVDTYFRPSFAAVPKAEAMVLWLRTHLPQYADRILVRTREYYRAA